MCGEIQSATAEEKTYTVNVDGFDLVCNKEGEIVTDTDLLEKLRQVRSDLAHKEQLPTYCICSNSALVGLATYKPADKKGWLAIKGLGETTFAKYGPQFLKLIKDLQ